MAIRIGEIAQQPLTATRKLVSVSSDRSFSQMLSDSLGEVNRLQQESIAMDQLFAAGAIDNIADVTIAAAKADIALNYAIEIINKVVAAYNEVMRLQL